MADHPQKNLPSPFYRVAVKALVKDDQQRLLVVQSDDELWELPGGGWEHGESLEECLSREFLEELNVTVAEIGPVEFFYRGRNPKGYMALRAVVKAKLSSHDFRPDDDMIAAKFVTKKEFLSLPMAPDEAAAKPYADQIWP